MQCIWSPSSSSNNGKWICNDKFTITIYLLYCLITWDIAALLCWWNDKASSETLLSLFFLSHSCTLAIFFWTSFSFFSFSLFLCSLLAFSLKFFPRNSCAFGIIHNIEFLSQTWSSSYLFPCEIKMYYIYMSKKKFDKFASHMLFYSHIISLVR